jgi:UDP-4-amino-4,6-dideoxy-N-acetyl-beta-L-altrosamine transaminase
MNPIPYGKQFISQEDIAAVTAALQSDFLTQGPRVEEFEKKFAEYNGCSFAVAVSNGTAALHLAALALGVKEGSNVITTPITFTASANCIHYCGGTVHFADIDTSTGLLNIEKVELLLKSKPKGFYSGIVPVDFAGYPLQLEAFKKLAEEHGLWILEDACHAPGGYFTDSKGAKQNCGNGVYSDAAIFSFHPVKHIATGEGGMITTNRRDIYEQLRTLRTHGITRKREDFVGYPSLEDAIDNDMMGGWYMEMQTLGYNYRIPDILTALGISQLSRAKAGLKRRRQIADRYDSAFSSRDTIKILNPFTNKDQIERGIGHAYHLYIIQIPNRIGLYDFLREHQIFAQVHYIPVHLMPFYRKLGWKKGDFPLAEGYYEHCLSLPMFPTLTDEEQDFVIEKVISFTNG